MSPSLKKCTQVVLVTMLVFQYTAINASAAYLAQQSLPDSKKFIAVPSRVAAFKQLDFEDEILAIARSSADRVCHYKKFDFATDFKLGVSHDSNSSSYLREGLSGYKKKRYSKLSSPWEYSFTQKRFDSVVKNCQEKADACVLVMGGVSACLIGLAAACPVAAPVVAPAALVVANVGAFAKITSTVAGKVKALYRPLVKYLVERQNKKRISKGWFSSLIRKMKFTAHDPMVKVPHLVFEELTCGKEKSETWSDSIKRMFSTSQRTGEIEVSYSPEMLATRAVMPHYVSLSKGKDTSVKRTRRASVAF